MASHKLCLEWLFYSISPCLGYRLCRCHFGSNYITHSLLTCGFRKYDDFNRKFVKQPYQLLDIIIEVISILLYILICFSNNDNSLKIVIQISIYSISKVFSSFKKKLIKRIRKQNQCMHGSK